MSAIQPHIQAIQPQQPTRNDRIEKYVNSQMDIWPSKKADTSLETRDCTQAVADDINLEHFLKTLH